MRINVSSISGGTVDNTGAPHHMAKAAMNHMTAFHACEWGRLGIRVNAVAPWVGSHVLTEPLLSVAPFADAVHRATPLGRVGESAEVARTVAFLCMDASSYISGQGHHRRRRRATVSATGFELRRRRRV